MNATFSQIGDNSCGDKALSGKYWPRMVTTRQVREALRQLRTDAKMDPGEFADDAGVNRATVYRIENMEQAYAPRIETISALVESRGRTLAEFFAQIEGASAISGGEIPADARDFLTLTPTLRQAALWYGKSLEESLQLGLTAESRPAPAQESRTKSAAGRRR